MLIRTATFVVALAISSVSIDSALAAPRRVDPGCEIALDETACAEAGDGTVVVGSEEAGSPHERSSRRSPQEPSAADAVAAMCLDSRAEAGAQGVPVPPQVEAACGTSQAVTQEQVLRAFRELPLYRGFIHTDPPGWTLVNLPTYFWCADNTGRSCAEIGASEQSVVLLGRRVQVRPRVLSYTWSFGDGTTATATGNTGRVTHVYRTPRTATVQITLTWTADFAVAGQPFQPIAGTTTTVSPPVPLVVRTARPVLVGGN